MVVNKSTVPVGACGRLKKIIRDNSKNKQISFDIASNPEFLKEGSAVQDFMRPNRVVIGAENEKAFDPVAMDEAKKIFLSKIEYCSNSYETAKDSDAIVFLTEWNEFREIDFVKIKKLLKNKLVFDLRNIFEPGKIKKLGFKYVGVGRS